NDDDRAWWGDSLSHHSLDPLVVVRCMVGRFSYSPPSAKRRREMSSLGRVKESPHHALNDAGRAWWGDSLTRPRLDILSSFGA
ncbi:hypothetical protein, partial [Thiolapillus sp.]|uniref:hypothetical protein n=1 Tax=Thiolapillus sp. TaxID=2017437 RepID=UPI003AF969B6